MSSALRGEAPSWVAGGVGHVRERTLELGPNIIALANIATMHVVGGERNWGPAALGGVIILFDLLFWLWLRIDLLWVFLPIFMVGVALIAYVFANPPTHYLAIGTSDGRRTNIISRNVEFLVRLQALIREKIDTQNINMIGQINITQGRFEAVRGPATP